MLFLYILVFCLKSWAWLSILIALGFFCISAKSVLIWAASRAFPSWKICFERPLFSNAVFNIVTMVWMGGFVRLLFWISQSLVGS